MKRVVVPSCLGLVLTGFITPVCRAAPIPVEMQAVACIQSKSTQAYRGPGIFGEYWWANRFLSRHGQIESFRGKTVDVVMLGDSIIHFWEWRHPASWGKFIDGKNGVLNLGYGGDRTENVIWRLEHGELDGYAAKNVVLMIGTNNNTSDSTNPTNVAAGVKRIVSIIRVKQPKAQIVLHPIFPRGASQESQRHAAARRRNDVTNELLRQFAEKDGQLVWLDFNSRFADESGWVPRTLMADEIHPTDAGYDIWIDELAKVLKK